MRRHSCRDTPREEQNDTLETSRSLTYNKVGDIKEERFQGAPLARAQDTHTQNENTQTHRGSINTFKVRTNEHYQGCIN